MSYLMNNHRPDRSDHQPPPPIPHNSPYPQGQQNYPQQHLPTPPSSTQPPSYADQQRSAILPKVGQTRCYWALLAADLQFIYLDPVLTYHLEDQADLLVGKTLLSFIHPEDQALAKRDLGSVLDNRTLHGSVTRVRFRRLSAVRRHLGHQGPPADWSEAEKIALDKTYMAVDLVINWAADGLVLCFLHASVDLNAVADNDENAKTGWTNWCGTPWMPPEQIELLYRRLLMCIPQPGTMSRVFQILLNESERPLLLSWPPDSAHGPTSRDFAKLVENVQISAGVPGGSDAKTSCTRRYKASQEMPAVFGCQVESIFIPHGNIIFACHKVNQTPPRTSTVNTPVPMNQVDYATAHYVGPHNPPYYEHGATYALPSHMVPHDSAYSNGLGSQPHAGVQSSYSPQRWAHATLPATVNNLRTDPYPATSPSQASHPSWSSGSPSPTYVDGGPSPSFERSLSPTYATYSSTQGSSAAAPSGSDVVPPPRRRISPASSRDQTGPIRSSSNRPSGVLRCSSCKTTSSPEWRKGPSGKKELCNACGLRYARSRAKKEGPNAAQARRRKDKGDNVKRESATPPSSASPYSTVRRNYTDGGFPASSAGSDVYTHPAHQALDNNMTPSPSPPASSVSFVHYTAGGHDSRPSYPSNGNSFYSAPSPLSGVHPPQEAHPPHYHQQGEEQHSPPSLSHHNHHGVTQLPPLQHISSYAGKVSPTVPSASQSSLPSPMIPGSYERDRERSHLPLTPLSAVEPRNAYRRSILTHQ